MTPATTPSTSRAIAPADAPRRPYARSARGAAGRAARFVLAVGAALSIFAAAPARADMPGELALRALSLLGVPYRYGGQSPQGGMDCSGLVWHVYREATGVVLPRRAVEMSRFGQDVDLTQLQPGDLVFFDTLGSAFSHVGIYVGEGRFVHSPSSGGTVTIAALGGRYWQSRFNGARRLIDTVPAEAGPRGDFGIGAPVDVRADFSIGRSAPAREQDAHQGRDLYQNEELYLN